MVELDMNTTTIPPNDPESPRWLLDLEKWEILPYTEVPQETLDVEGYGVVSYTWGYIQDSGNSAPDPPRGLLWDVPGVTEWSLSKAKEAMKMIGTRYIWWDWMCVPQRVKGMKELSRELGEVQAQEIGKQMHIYGKARKSIVWLHSTSWTKESTLKKLLHLQSPEADSKEPIDMQKHVDQVTVQLDAARSEEYWLCSGWTLQEGVLLHETDLIDGSGNALPGPDFFMGDQATVCDLTVPITRLAYELAIGYFIRSQGHEPDVGTPCPHTTYLLSKMPDIWLRRSLQTFMASGFVGFWKNSPLDILSGKRGRKFGNIKDSCWALVGALGIDDIEVTYDKNVSMEEVKRRLFVALIDKYQWVMLSLPFPGFRIPEGGGQNAPERNFRWIDVADGVMLPVHAFCVELKPQPKSSQERLPTLSYTHDLRIKGDKGEKITLYRASEDGTTWFRHYRQDKDGLKIVSTKEVAFAEDKLLSDAWLLPLHHINMKPGVSGRRCLTLLGLNHHISDILPARANFGGIIDIKGVGQEKVEVDEIILNPSL